MHSSTLSGGRVTIKMQVVVVVAVIAVNAINISLLTRMSLADTVLVPVWIVQQVTNNTNIAQTNISTVIYQQLYR